MLSGVLLYMTSCDDFLNINEDPNNPVDAPLFQLLTSVQVDMGGALGNHIGGLSAIPQAYVGQVFQRGTTQQDYAVNGADFEVITAWNILYTRALMDNELIITKAKEQEANDYLGIAQIMKAYSFSQLVDMYGDVPFSEAFQGTANPSASYDDDEAVYDEVLALLDTGIMSLNAVTTQTVGGDDVFYGGNLDNWRKFAKSLKLKLLTQLRLVRNVSAEVDALITEGDLISDVSEDFQLTYGTSVAPDNRNPVYVQEYSPGAAQYYINPFFYEAMAGLNTFGHRGYGAQVGAVDPRIPYYFFNQLTGGSVAENPCAYCGTDAQPAGSSGTGVAALDGTGFLSIYQFSFNIDPNEGFAQGVSQTVAGLYPVGGRYDDGQGGGVNFNGDGTTAQRFLTHFAVKFLEAELYLTGVATGDARTAFQEALEAAFAKVDDVVNNAGGTAQSIPNLDATAVGDYIAAVMADYDAVDDTGKLEHIMTQKWIASFGYSTDAYTDFRRTGFPVLHDGNNDALSVTSRTREFPFSMPWVDANLSINANSPEQKLIATDDARIFWDVN